jgi:hypothetical protein
MKALASMVVLAVCTVTAVSSGQGTSGGDPKSNSLAAAVALPSFGLDLGLVRGLVAWVDTDSMMFDALAGHVGSNTTLGIQNGTTAPVRIGIRSGKGGTSATINGQPLKAGEVPRAMNNFSPELQGMVKRALVAPWAFGADVDLPPSGLVRISIPNEYSGEYSLFFVFGNMPRVLLQGDDVTLAAGGTTKITLTLTADKSGKYRLREVK